MSPLLIIVQMVRRVMFPVLSSIQNDDARMRRAHLQVEHALMLVMAPICLGLAAMAGPFVHVVLGPAWEPVVPILVLMALRTLLSPINDLNSVLVAAKGHARFQFRWTVLSSTAAVGTLLLSVPYGLEVAMTTRLALALVMAPAYASFAFPLIGQSWIAFGKALLAPVASATAMYLVVRALDGAMAAAELSDPLRLIICIPTGAAVYAGLLLTVDRRRSLDLLRTLTRRRTKP
jgi:O-antigen/teichoic acid export membrane protein